MTSLLYFLGGFALGIAIALSVWFLQKRAGKQVAEKIYADMESRLQSMFGDLSLNALTKVTDIATSKLGTERKLDAQELESKKRLIDQQLSTMNTELLKVSKLVSDLEKDRETKFGQLTSELANANKQTASLLQTTNTLKEALANSRARGQWGERMAEDVIRMAGLSEGPSYIKQKAIEGVGSKPDFTFLLPKNLRLNMDVKFPFDNYMRFLDAKTEAEKDKHKADFFNDVKNKLKEVTSRDYINQQTVDYVLYFVPNEQIFAFIHEEDASIIDVALKKKVIVCSPVTLFAVLAVIRQAVDNFSLGQTSNEIVSLLGGFRAQWGKFVMKLETVGKRIDDAQKEYQALITTRKSELERPLNKIESLRIQKGLEIDEQKQPLITIEGSDATQSGDGPAELADSSFNNR